MSVVAHGPLVFSYPPHCSGKVIWFHVGCLCLSICHLSIGIFFPDNILIKYGGFSPNLVCFIDIVEIWFGIANGKILSISESFLPTTG